MTLPDMNGEGNVQIIKVRSAARFHIAVGDTHDSAFITVTKEGLEELRVMINKELERLTC